MTTLRLEHVNITVDDPDRTAALLGRLFDWQVRWRGTGQSGGYSVHVGAGDHYVALYNSRAGDGPAAPFAKGRPLNHIGIEVDDLDAMDARVTAEGLVPFNHADYAPGRRFYFFDPDGIEYEIVSYRKG